MTEVISRRRSFVETFAPLTTLMVGLATATDFLTHRPDGRAIIWRRQLLAELTSDTYAKHIGNFGHSVATMIPFTLASEVLHRVAEERNSPAIETVANILPFLGFIFTAGLNLYVESVTPHNTQAFGDILFGLGGMFLAHVATRGAMQRWYRTNPPNQV